MIPQKFSFIMKPGTSVKQSADSYFFSQYPNDNRCNVLTNQTDKIKKDIEDIYSRKASNFDEGKPYGTELRNAYLILCKQQQSIKMKALLNATCEKDSTPLDLPKQITELNVDTSNNLVDTSKNLVDTSIPNTTNVSFFSKNKLYIGFGAIVVVIGTYIILRKQK